MASAVPEPFRLHVPDDVLDDLRERLWRSPWSSATATSIPHMSRGRPPEAPAGARQSSHGRGLKALLPPQREAAA